MAALAREPSLARALREAGFGETALARAERIASGHVDAVRLPLVHDALLDHTDEDDAAGRLLLALLSYAAPVEAARLRGLVPEVVDALLAVGLVSRRGEELRSPYRTLPIAGLVVV